MKGFPYFLDSVYQFISLFFFHSQSVFIFAFLKHNSCNWMLIVYFLTCKNLILFLSLFPFYFWTLSFHFGILSLKPSEVLLSSDSVASAVTLLTCAWEVPGSNPDYGTTNPYWGFSWFSSVPSCNCNSSTISSSQLLASRYFKIRHLIIAEM